MRERKDINSQRKGKWAELIDADQSGGGGAGGGGWDGNGGRKNGNVGS